MKFTFCLLIVAFAATVYSQSLPNLQATNVTTNCFYFNRGPDCRNPSWSEDGVPDSERTTLTNTQCSNDVTFKKTSNTIFNQEVNEAIAAGRK